MNEGIKLHIPAHIYEEIDYYVQQTEQEISGLGRIVKDDDGTLRVTKVYLPKQENASSSTDLDQDAVAELMYTSREDEGDLTFWWHSHNSMAAFWSGTDHATIRELGKNGYIVATVFNHKREFKTAYYQGNVGFYPELFIDNVPTSFHAMPLKSDIEQWDKNVKEAVTEKTYMPTWSKGKKGKKNKNVQQTMLGGKGYYDDAWEMGKQWCATRQGWYWENDIPVVTDIETLCDKVGYFEATQWEEMYCEEHNVSWHDIDDQKLLAYYNRFDGDYNKALTHLMVNEGVQ